MPGSGTTPLQLWPIPLSTDDPNVPDDVGGLALAIEKTVMQVYANASTRDSRVTAPTEGMFAFLKGTDTVTYYDGTQWKSWSGAAPPAITYGSTVPPDSSGNNGDVFFKI